MNRKIMALLIKYELGVFKVDGQLDSQNVYSFALYFENLIEQAKTVVVALDKLFEMDKTVLSILRQLYLKAIERNKDFYLLGKENQKIEIGFIEDMLNKNM